jgi:dTDP-4-dehydrorhamnose reductase
VRVLVTGASGMLGGTLVERWRGRHEVLATGGGAKPSRDGWRYLPFDLSATDHGPLLDWAKPEVIVHCAAWTGVDACEADPQRAATINGRSVERLRAAAPDARFLYISSDAVVNPISAYGKSKALGETLLGDGGVSVRTTVVGWNLDPKRQSFAEWIVRTLGRGEPITLFEDGLFTPIAASQLADELEFLAGRSERGVWAVTGREGVSKHDFGVALATALGLDTALIGKGRMADVRFTAPRAADQRLDVASYEQLFGRRLPSVTETIQALVVDETRV